MFSHHSKTYNSVNVMEKCTNPVRQCYKIFHNMLYETQTVCKGNVFNEMHYY